MFGFALQVWGEYALFSRPEMKVERVSYDVMTPSAARGILEAIHWKPAIRYYIDEIWVLNPIQFSNIRRNEVSKPIPARSVSAAMKDDSKLLFQSSNADRQQRASILLKDVRYVIRAHFELTDQAGAEDTEEKHYNIFLRRARKGQTYHRPYFGCREFPVHFELIEEEDELQAPIAEDRDLSWMLYDMDFANPADPQPVFFRAKLEQGVLKIPRELHKRGEGG